MSLHDYRCPVCGHVFADIHVPIAIGAQRGAPTCLTCGRETEWIPQVGRMDAYEPFQEFTAFDGRNRPRRVESLRQLRAIEAESERMAASGEGQQMVWRQYSQDRSNRDANTLGPDPSEQPDPAIVRKKLKPIAMDDRTADRTAYGPGVSDVNTSALGGLD